MHASGCTEVVINALVALRVDEAAASAACKAIAMLARNVLAEVAARTQSVLVSQYMDPLQRRVQITFAIGFIKATGYTVSSVDCVPPDVIPLAAFQITPYCRPTTISRSSGRYMHVFSNEEESVLLS